MSKERFNPALHPASGYFFEDENGLIHRGKNWAEVAAKIATYRRVNKLPPGSPEDEVHAQAILRQPTHAVKV